MNFLKIAKFDLVKMLSEIVQFHKYIRIKMLISTAKNICHKVSKPILSKIDIFRGKHAGETCYIVGDGITIKSMDFTNFTKLPTFTLNYLQFHNEIQNLQVNYSVFSEPWYFYPFSLSAVDSTSRSPLWRNRIQAEFKKYIKKRENTKYFANLSNFPSLQTNKNVYFLFKRIDNFDFFEHCSDANENPFAGSLNHAICLALLMGFKKIILIGCDYTHSDARQGHWYEKGKGYILRQPNYNKGFLKIACQYAEILTITLDCGSYNLPACTYSEFTGVKPKFRENTELTSNKNLHLLNSWPPYKIF